MRFIYFIAFLLFSQISFAQSLVDTTDKRITGFNQNIEFIKNNPASSNALHSLNFQFSSLTYEDGLRYFHRVDPSLSNSHDYKELEEKIALGALSKPDIIIKNFPMWAAGGKLFMPDTIIKSHKLILLNFWSSMCVPCRENSKFLKQLYEKYSPSGFSIIGIYIGEPDTSIWKAAIKKDGIGLWKQGIDANKNIQTNLGVKFTPCYILIDNNMKIIGSFNGRIIGLLNLEKKITEYLKP
jgi:thiol-disulfide isomerase/thioredoxin